MRIAKSRSSKRKGGKSTTIRFKKTIDSSSLANPKESSHQENLPVEVDTSEKEYFIPGTNTELNEIISDQSISEKSNGRRMSGSREKKKPKASFTLEDFDSEIIQSIQYGKRKSFKKYEKGNGQETLLLNSANSDHSQDREIMGELENSLEKSLSGKYENSKDQLSTDELENIPVKTPPSKPKIDIKEVGEPKKTTKRERKTTISPKTLSSESKKSSKETIDTIKDIEQSNFEKNKPVKDIKVLVIEKLEGLNRPTNVIEFSSVLKNSIPKTKLPALIKEMGEEGLINTKLIQKKTLFFSSKDEIIDKETNEAYLLEIEKVKKEITSEQIHLNKLKNVLKDLGSAMTNNEIQEKIDLTINKLEIINKTLDEIRKEKVVEKPLFQKETEKIHGLEKQLKSRTKLYKNIKSILEEGFSKTWKELLKDIGIEEE